MNDAQELYLGLFAPADEPIPAAAKATIQENSELHGQPGPPPSAENELGDAIWKVLGCIDFDVLLQAESEQQQ